MYNILLACDGHYYDNWAISCIKSLNHYVPWISVTVIIVNPTHVNKISNVRYVYEYREFQSEQSKIAYYQAVRFLKCCEIFKADDLVMSIDCDTLLQEPFSQKEFIKICSDIHIQRHQKNIRWMAGLVTYGKDMKFRQRLKDELLAIPIENWKYGRDQDVLKLLSNEFHFNPLYVGDWMSFGRGSGKFITLKGDQKIAPSYLDVYSSILSKIN